VRVKDDLPRDQGFVRPTVLILTPMRSTAGRIVRRMLQLCPAAHGRADAVNKLDRFADDFGDGDSDDDDDDDGGGDDGGKKRKKAMWIPEDHKQVFRGNTDDHFRLGVKVTKASVRMYVDFFGSDVLVASPLGAFAKFLSLSSHFIFFSLHLDGGDEEDGGGGGGGGDDRESR